MHKLYELKDKLMNELEDYSENGKFSKDDVESIKYVASAVDHLCNIMNDEEGYSMDGDYNYDGESYSRRNRGYSRARGRNARRDSMGRYSRRGYSMANDSIVSELRDLMNDAPDERTRQEFERFIKKVEGM